MENSIFLKQEKEIQEAEEAERLWQGESEASPQVPGPPSPEYREEKQRSDTEPSPRMSPSWGHQSRASLSLGDLTAGPGALSSPPLPPLEFHSTPLKTANTQDSGAAPNAERAPSGITDTGKPYSDPWEPSSAAKQSTSHYTSYPEESAFPTSQTPHPDLCGLRDASRNKSKHQGLRFELLQEEDSNSNSDLEQPEIGASEAAPSMLEVAIQNAKAYLLSTSSKSGLNL